ncbi:MAG: hemolysin III family protein [Chloroflexi bacterium]|nr:MAG: hemolysin III family protein [Chloroflexota bacterium]MBL1194564.1 hemolysin III family protein [Chloroflexota bacterium]NOH11853.1 hemolysin III family protein [Chloroflexota bacterium]
MNSSELPRYSLGEEIANSITHAVGIVLSIGGLAVLTAFASVFGNAWHIVGVSIFGASLILLYTSSTLYHSIQLPRAKSVLRVLDHSAIFLLIAGTYTPFTLVNLRGVWGWTIFGVVWGLAALGIVFKVTMLKKWSFLSIILYAGMGWLVVVAIKPMLATVAAGGLLLLLLGGLAYTGGIIFYVWRKLPYHHAIWHLFVLTGSLLHFFAVLFYVIPLA